MKGKDREVEKEDDQEIGTEVDPATKTVKGREVVDEDRGVEKGDHGVEKGDQGVEKGDREAGIDGHVNTEDRGLVRDPKQTDITTSGEGLVVLHIMNTRLKLFRRSVKFTGAKSRN